MGDWYRRRWEPESRDSSRRFELHTGGDGRRDHQRGPLRPRADDFFEDNGGAEERRNPRYQSSLLPESQHQTTSQQTQDPRKLLARGVDGSSAFGQDKDAAHRTGLENKRGNHATEQEQARRAYTQPPALVPKHGRNDREESANQTQVLRAGPVDSSEKRREPGMMDESTLNRGPWSEAQPNSRDAMKVPPSQTSKTTASDTMGRDEKNHKSKRNRIPPIAPMSRQSHDDENRISSATSPSTRSPLATTLRVSGTPGLPGDNSEAQTLTTAFTNIHTPEIHQPAKDVQDFADPQYGRAQSNASGSRPNLANVRTMKLSNCLPSLVDDIAKTISVTTDLDSKSAAFFRERNVYTQWQERTGSTDAFSDSNNQEIARINRDIESVQKQKSQQQNLRRLASLDIVAALDSILLESSASSQVDNGAKSDSQISELKQENASLRQALDKTNSLLEAHATRLKSIETQQREQRNTNPVAPDATELERRLEMISAQLMDTNGLAHSLVAGKASIDCETRLTDLEKRLEATQTKHSKDLQDLHQNFDKQNNLLPPIAKLEGRLLQCESQLRGLSKVQESAGAQLSASELETLYDQLEQKIEERVVKLPLSSAEKAESFRTVETTLAALKKSMEDVQEKLKDYTRERDYTSKNVGVKLDTLEARMESAQSKCSELSQAVEVIKHEQFMIQSRGDSLHSRLAAVEAGVQQQKGSLVDTNERNSQAFAQAKTRLDKFQSWVQSVTPMIAKLQESTLEQHSITASKEKPPNASSQVQSARSEWEVDERRQATPNAANGFGDTQDIRQKLSTLENYVGAHEQRLNTFTLEPFLRSIVHQMRIMYPYPDQISRSIEALRTSSNQVASQLTNVQVRLAVVEKEVKEKGSAGGTLSEMLPQLDPVRQDIVALKAGVGELSSRTKEQAQQLQKQLEGGGTTQADSRNAEFLMQAVQKLRESTEQTNGRLDTIDDKVVEEGRRREQLRKDFVLVLDTTKSEYDEEINHVRDALSQLQAEYDNTVNRIRELEDGFVQTYGDLQNQVATLRLTLGRKGAAKVRSSTSPVRSNESSGTRGKSRPWKQASSDYSRGIVKRLKRKRGASSSLSDSNGADGSTHKKKLS